MTFLVCQRQRAGSHTKMKTAQVNLMAKLEHRLVDTVALLLGYKNTVQQRLAADLCYPSSLQHAKYNPKSKKERGKERKKHNKNLQNTENSDSACVRAHARTHARARTHTHTHTRARARASTRTRSLPLSSCQNVAPRCCYAWLCALFHSFQVFSQQAHPKMIKTATYDDNIQNP